MKVMKAEDRQRIIEAQAASWRIIGTYASVCHLTKDIVWKTNVELLLDKIEEQKEKIEKLIDSIPD